MPNLNSLDKMLPDSISLDVLKMILEDWIGRRTDIDQLREDIKRLDPTGKAIPDLESRLRAIQKREKLID